MTLTSDIAQVQNYCYQRQLKMLFNNPTRYELLSPYTSKQWTKDQLDMRRKAEILKRSSPPSTGGSKGNTLTKNQKFSLLVRGKLENNTQTTCKEEPMLSSSSDVPGPIVMLYEDTNVPLYNFAAPTRTFAIIDSGTTQEFVFHVDQIDWNAGETKRLGVLEIQNVTSEYLTFSLEIPTQTITKLPTFSVTFNQTEISGTSTISIFNNIIYIQKKLSTVEGYYYEWFLTAKDAFSISDSNAVVCTIV